MAREHTDVAMAHTVTTTTKVPRRHPLMEGRGVRVALVCACATVADTERLSPRGRHEATALGRGVHQLLAKPFANALRNASPHHRHSTWLWCSPRNAAEETAQHMSTAWPGLGVRKALPALRVLAPSDGTSARGSEAFAHVVRIARSMLCGTHVFVAPPCLLRALLHAMTGMHNVVVAPGAVSVFVLWFDAAGRPVVRTECVNSHEVLVAGGFATTCLPTRLQEAMVVE